MSKPSKHTPNKSSTDDTTAILQEVELYFTSIFSADTKRLKHSLEINFGTASAQKIDDIIDRIESYKRTATVPLDFRGITHPETKNFIVTVKPNHII